MPPGHPLPPERLTSLDDLRGAPAVLVFYPADFTPVCGAELALFSQIHPDLTQMGVRVVGISVDSAWCHRAYAKERKIPFPLLSDFEPKGAVARRYRAYDEEDGICERALYVLDREGTIRWSHVSPMDVNPGVDGVFDALERLEGPAKGPTLAGDEARP